MTTKTINLYQFVELSDEAKQKAREWFREVSSGNFNDFDFEYFKDDFINMMSIFGFEVDGVFYSGFSSQGDGASFAGKYSYA